ncbi:MAG TPA: amidase [Candidatus Nanopelagicales bacterium]|nr:amidase [Candidatus Nanopelagicales bacterium]
MATVERASAYVDDALGRDDMVGLLDRLARRDVSPDELRKAAVSRARTVNDRLNAVTCWVDDETLAADDGPFSGVPTLIKDNEHLAGYPTTQGSQAVADRTAEISGPWASSALALGLAPVAKTTLSEFGLTATAETLRFGATRNPWDLSRSSGGSSGGSGALVAAGAVPLAHGNDGGGSIRIPASCCGLVGLKPSRGRLPDTAVMVPVNIAVQGVLTRSVRDTARYYAEVEKQSPAKGLPEIGLVEGPSSQRLRIGVVTVPPMGLPVDPVVVAPVEATAALLASLGHEIVDVPHPVDDSFGPDFLRYWGLLAGLSRTMGRLEYGDGFDPDAVEPFTRQLGSVAKEQAARMPSTLLRLRRLATKHESVWSDCDVYLSPTLAHEPAEIGWLGAEVDPRTHLLRVLRYVSFTPLQNVTGSPAISLPLGRGASGVPIGVHVAAPFGEERRLLELAYELEAAHPWPLLTD